ncbi:hypothetical protein [Anabaena sp. UHCC 0451]|uniref:hypothetical protein n=1 Tax=Anabaena sp. UHCC 0451 TaxID=2055235 RepID=UPI002B20C5D7|nr:hypothetical protein [Anabaena sp. UHCC 0451]MEA5576398.1 hypothetical protein [Anabaena sp. UHCC 0451]
MSTQLFATVSVEQQEIIAGGYDDGYDGYDGYDDSYHFDDLAKYESKRERESYGYANRYGSGFSNNSSERIKSLVRSRLFA